MSCQGAIYDLDSSLYSASPPSFKVGSVEIQNIIGFNDRSLIESSGFDVAGVKYYAFHGDGGDVISGAKGPASGIIYIVKTTQFFLIAVYKRMVYTTLHVEKKLSILLTTWLITVFEK
ncbi:hypothetical protein INT45_002525 [Circinella minor]|uniref:Profilin n=1 Tax=Circinella minor TaxID=1195481 RepID=A0A8H7VT25_9FUNG|nr:hypothetical protein INT45_002525 [Circinella minor]